MKMTLIKIDQAPVITKLRQCRPYLVHPDTGQIFGYYQISVKWADGTRKVFSSKEEANAYVEKRSVNKTAIEAEVPTGFREAQAVKASFLIKDEPVEEQTEFSVILEDNGEKRIVVIKAIRAITGLGLIESKELITTLPCVVKEDISKEEAQEIKTKLEEAGGKAEIK